MSIGPCPRWTWSCSPETPQKNRTLCSLMGPPRRSVNPQVWVLETTNHNPPQVKRKCRLDTSNRPDCQAFPARYTGLVQTWNLSGDLQCPLGLVSLKH